MRHWRRYVLAALFVVALVGSAAYIGRQIQIANEPPAFTCATTNYAACSNTEKWITGLSARQFVFSEPLPGRLLAVEVRDGPSGIPNPDRWFALLTMEGLEPMLVACVYSSDDMVGCDDP